MSDQILLRDDADHIATLTLNSPGSLNALSNAMLAALTAEIASLATDPAIRVVILRGNGRAFCAGHDLKEMQAARQAPDNGRAAFEALFNSCGAMMQALIALPQPVIAQVHATAAAAGCQLVASCDLVVASDAARFGVNGVNIGLFCSTPMVALTRKVPHAVAFEMLTTGEFIAAPRAREVGLVNRVTTSDDLEAETRALANTIAAKLPLAVRIGKRAFYEQSELGLSAAYAYTGGVMVENMLNRDTNEGMTAFVEKRTPNWQA
jgi:enoyl-CoA hydratase/carnithine racemase